MGNTERDDLSQLGGQDGAWRSFVGSPDGRRGQELPLQSTARPQSEAQTGRAPRALPGHPRPGARHRRPLRAVSCWRGGRWNAASRHPGIAQPGVSHTHSLTSFSAHFIPFPTQCLPRSLIPTRRSTRPAFPGHVPSTRRAARAQNTGRHPIDCNTQPPTQG